MRIGIYGGTFDPIHNGHLILARDVVENFELDELIFIPNAISPHRLRENPAPDALRYQMVLAAIADEPRFKADDIELRRGGISYTIDTILALKEGYSLDTQVFYLIGQDNSDELHTWHRFKELQHLVTFVVLNRGTGSTEYLLPAPKGRRVDISATEIRDRIAKSQSIRYLVPDAVAQIIAHHHLYKESSH